MKWILAGWCAAALVSGGSGCGGVGSLDVGSNDAGAGQVDAGARPASAASGVWRGTIDGVQFPSGSNVMTLTVTAGHNGTVRGTVVFGDGPALSPPTDPNVGYPPDFVDTVGGEPPPLYEGFPYTGEQMVFDGSELDLGLFMYEVWKDWCAMQHVYAQETDGGAPAYACLPTTTGVIAGPNTCFLEPGGPNDLMPVDCTRWSLCGHFCVCSATSCGIPELSDSPSALASFSLKLSGDHLDSSTVHLTRVK